MHEEVAGSNPVPVPRSMRKQWRIRRLVGAILLVGAALSLCHSLSLSQSRPALAGTDGNQKVRLIGLPSVITIPETRTFPLTVSYDPSAFGGTVPQTGIQEIGGPLFSFEPSLDGGYYLTPVRTGRTILRAWAGHLSRDYEVVVGKLHRVRVAVPDRWQSEGGFAGGSLCLLLDNRAETLQDYLREDSFSIPIRYSGTFTPKGGPRSGYSIGISGEGLLSPSRGISLCDLSSILRGYSKAELFAGADVVLSVHTDTDGVALDGYADPELRSWMPIRLSFRGPASNDTGEGETEWDTQQGGVYERSDRVTFRTKDGKPLEGTVFRDDYPYVFTPGFTGGSPREYRITMKEKGGLTEVVKPGRDLSMWFAGEKSLGFAVEAVIGDGEIYWKDFTAKTTPGGRVFCGLLPLDESKPFTWDNTGVYLKTDFPTPGRIRVGVQVRAHSWMASNSKTFMEHTVFDAGKDTKILIAEYNDVEDWVSSFVATRKFTIDIDIVPVDRPRELTVIMMNNIESLLEDVDGKINDCIVNGKTFDYWKTNTIEYSYK